MRNNFRSTSLTGASPLPSLNLVRTCTSSKSSSSTIQPILPDTFSTTVLKTNRTKKHVRFASVLEIIQEKPSLTNHDKSVISITKSKPIIDPRQEDTPIYGAYVEYLEKQGAFTSDFSERRRLSQSISPPSESEVEQSTSSNRSVIQNKLSEGVMDSITVTTPPPHLPRIVHEPTIRKKNNNNGDNNKNNNIIIINRSLSVTNSSAKRKEINPRISSRNIEPRKTHKSVSNQNHSTSAGSTVTQVDYSLSKIKDLTSNERPVRVENRVGRKIVPECYSSKRFTEIIGGSLSGANNHQILHLPESCVLPKLSKTPQSHRHNYITNEPYFFQNHNKDRLQPVIH